MVDTVIGVRFLALNMKLKIENANYSFEVLKMSFINNVKISVKFRSKNQINHFVSVAIKRDVPCVKKRNFLVIKDEFSIIIFQKFPNKYHLNITGIKSLSEVPKVIRWIVCYYCNPKEFKYEGFTIDNITATFDLGFKIPLHQIATHLDSSKFNPERFPGLCLRHAQKTVVIFSSGKINILGCKSRKEVVKIWREVRNVIIVIRKEVILLQ